MAYKGMQMMQLGEHSAQYCDSRAGSLRVMVYLSPTRTAYDRGTADAYFADDVPYLMIGDAQGPDSMRGAEEWWPLYLHGEQIGELRDDASGLTIHVGDGPEFAPEADCKRIGDLR